MPYLQISIVVFREILEIALILTILISASKGIAKRGLFIGIGLFLGILASLAMAYFTDKISDALNGLGQEFFNGLILFATAFMIAWTTIWMQKHSKTISSELKNLTNSVSKGKKHLYAISVVVLLTMLREGAEIVLFCYGQYISGSPFFAIVLGLLIGVFCGSLVGFAIYFGLLNKKISRYFFAITTWLLVLFACSMASKATGFWTDAAIFAPIIDPLFDLSQSVPQNSIIGQILHFVVGYIDRPSLAQVIAYCCTFVLLFFGLKIAKNI